MGAVGEIIGGIGEWIGAGKRKQELEKALADPRVQAQAREARRARKRLKKGKYGLSDAAKRDLGEEAERAFETQTKDLTADLIRTQATTGPFGAGVTDKNLRDISKSGADVVGTSAGDAEELSRALAMKRAARDRAIVQQGAQQTFAEAQLMGDIKADKAAAIGKTFGGVGDVGVAVATGGASEVVNPIDTGGTKIGQKLGGGTTEPVDP